MNIKILKVYLNNCTRLGLKPSWEGLRVFKNNYKKYIGGII